MKIKRLYFVVLILSIFFLNVEAKRKDKKEKTEQKVEIKSSQDSSEIYKKKWEELKLELDSFKSLNLKHVKELDSFRLKVEKQDEEIKALKSEQGFLDTCMVRLANRWLFEKYDKVETERAISYFDKVYSSKLKDKYSIVQELLRNYESSYREFQTILKEAQNDRDRTNKFADDKSYRLKYENKIKSMFYYKTYYNSDWNIRYLNGEIKRAINVLKKHTKDYPADFDSLIDRDF